MPELPEVETFRRRFLYGVNDSPILVGRRIREAILLWERTLAEPTPAAFKERIKGQFIQDIDRRGKYLLIRLSTDVLVIHLRMSGDLMVEAIDDQAAVHHRLLINLDNESRLAFNDTRKFGRVWLTKDSEAMLSHLGPEPLASAFTTDLLFAKLQTRQRKIKPLLLDQHFLAGMGNIYTDEALFYAGLHPETAANQISFDQTKTLWEGIHAVLSEGIRRNGASIDWVYRGGSFQNYFQVYGRGGESCYKCGTTIERLVVGQRSTHICSKCQPLKRVQV